MVRTPTWVPPPRIQSWKIMGQAQEVLSKIQMDAGENFSQDTIDKFKSDPQFYREFVKAVEVLINGNFPIVGILYPVVAYSANKTASDAHKRPRASLCPRQSQGVYDGDPWW